MFNKIDFEKLIVQLKPEGFSYKGNFGSARFTRKEIDRTITIGIGYNEYFPHSASIKGVSVDIYIPEVEDILETYGLSNEYKSTFGKVFQDLEGIDYAKLTSEINSDETFDVVKSIVEDILEIGVMPFLARFTSLKEVASFLAEKEFEEIVPYIQGAILLPKTVLIMKLAHHPDFKKRLVEFRNVLLEYAPKNKKYQILLNQYDELFSKDL